MASRRRPGSASGSARSEAPSAGGRSVSSSASSRLLFRSVTKTSRLQGDAPVLNAYSNEVYLALNTRGGAVWERLRKESQRLQEQLLPGQPEQLPGPPEKEQPEPVPIKKPPEKPPGNPPEEQNQLTRLSIELVSARGLRADLLPGMGKSDPYCTCEIAGKPHTQLKTKVIDDTLDPVWNHTSSMGGYAVGDSLEFAVWDSDSFKSDDLLGRATLSSSRFQDACFDGELELREAGKNIKAFLRVRVALVGNDLQPPAPTSKPLPPAPTSKPLPKPPSPAPKSVATPLQAAPASSPKQPSSPPKPLSTPTTPAAPATLPKPSPAPKPSPTTPPASKPSPTPQTAPKPSPTLPPASKPTPTPPPAPSTSKPIIQRKPQQKPKPTPGAARQEPRKRNWSDADPKKWVFADVEYGGSYSYANGKEQGAIFSRCKPHK
ncbi:unnamed protein product [Polarella glacialis]|uniref:C2 domain-containing protein n=1 Tax=Polarella glacialis TaxID=89957 RepID=A0A813G1M3_POLGL|nr:unnamed protein product [Polarella glacialis]